MDQDADEDRYVGERTDNQRRSNRCEEYSKPVHRIVSQEWRLQNPKVTLTGPAAATLFVPTLG